MKRLLTAALCAVLGAGAATAAPQDDDWEFQEDPAQNLMVAAVRYEAGAAIIVQCRAGALTAVLVGLTPSDSRLELRATRADGRQDVQVWAPAGAAGAFRSETAGRDVRFLRGGGGYSLRTPEGAATRLRADFDLPTQSANLDRVLTGCGWALSDDRDGLARVGPEVSLSDPEARPSRRRSGPSRPRAGEGNSRAETAPSGPPPPPPAETQLSCIIRALRLTECRPDYSPAPGARSRVEDLEWLQDRQVYASAGVETEGKVMFIRNGPLITVIDYIATVPAR
jgi:hypothetical protein